MSKLTQLQQRIKSVGTIQKTTHAMRLTSMSAHTRLNKRKQAFTQYVNHVRRLAQYVPFTNQKPTRMREIALVIGAQKGLCGAFHSTLIKYATTHLSGPDAPPCVCIGDKTASALKSADIHPTTVYRSLKDAALETCTHAILSDAIGAPARYTHITVYAMHPESFFYQTPQTHTIDLPHAFSHSTEHTSEAPENMSGGETITYEQDPHTLSRAVRRCVMHARLEEVLFNALIAEHAARFVSMDSATRNADNLIHAMQRDYNKLRQASITRELIDLTSGRL